MTGLASVARMVVVAVGVGLVLVQLMLQPPLGDLQALALYMAASSVVTLAVGGMLVGALDRARAMTLRVRIALGAVIGAVVGLFNVLIVANLMFVSTAHDLRLLAALVGFSSLVSFAFSGWVARRVTAQIDVVGRRIISLATGDYATRIDPAGADEIARQAHALNELSRLLEAADEARAALDRERRDLTIAISHDLRTPLASICAMAEALMDGVVSDPEPVARYHATIRREVERLARMVDDLFQLAQINAHALPLERRPVSLHDIAAEVTDGMQARASAAGIMLSFASSERLPPILVDGSLLERAVGNVIANAIEHTPPGGQVAVSATQVGTTHRLAVTDTGEGVDAASQQRVWEAFFRVDPSRNRVAGRTDGVGLGLAIVRGVVDAHGGTVGLQSEPGRGSTFTIDLPAEAAG